MGKQDTSWVGRVPYRVETERLVLRAPEPAEAARAKAAIDPELAYLARWLPFAAAGPVDVADHVARLRTWRADFDLDHSYHYEVIGRADDAVIGCASLLATGDRLNRPAAGEPHRVREIGYWIAESAAGRGLASEATCALVRVGFELLGLARIEIRVEPANAPSARVAEKAGFVHEGVARAAVPYASRMVANPSDGAEPDSGPRRDLAMWAQVADDYAAAGDASPAASVAVRAYSVTGEELL